VQINIKKVKTSNEVKFGTVSVLITQRTPVLITFQHYHATQCLVRHIQCWKHDQKYKTKTETGLVI